MEVLVERAVSRVEFPEYRAFDPNANGAQGQGENILRKAADARIVAETGILESACTYCISV